jgi:hypothetical protein
MDTIIILATTCLVLLIVIFIFVERRKSYRRNQSGIENIPVIFKFSDNLDRRKTIATCRPHTSSLGDRIGLGLVFCHCSLTLVKYD